MSSGTSSMMCQYCSCYRNHILTISQKYQCLECGTFYGDKEPHYTPPARTERDWRILRWGVRHGHLLDDTFKTYGTYEEQVTAMTAACPVPSEEDVKR